MNIRRDFIHDKGVLGFVYFLEHIGKDGVVISSERIENVLPDVSRDYTLSASYLSGSQYAAFYIGLYTENRTPLVSDDMVSLMADAGESITYDGSVRLTLTPDALADGLFSNFGTPALFDYNTSAETVRGGFITSSNTRGGNTGLLASAILFPSPKILAVGESLSVKAGIQLVNV